MFPYHLDLWHQWNFQVLADDVAVWSITFVCSVVLVPLADNELWSGHPPACIFNLTEIENLYIVTSNLGYVDFGE